MQTHIVQVLSMQVPIVQVLSMQVHIMQMSSCTKQRHHCTGTTPRSLENDVFTFLVSIHA